MIDVGERSLGQTGQIFTPSYTRFDASLQYQRKFAGRSVMFQFNVRNLNDELFENDQGAWGTPRSFVGSVRFQF